MKKERENQPIDDLFARKLGNMSLLPSADGFERLRSRMAQDAPTHKVVFWRNPAVQRYMAAAACLVLLCGLSWFYWSTGFMSEKSTVAIQQPMPSDKASNKHIGKIADELVHQKQPVNADNQQINNEQIAQNANTPRNSQQSSRLPALRRSNISLEQPLSTSANQVTPTVAQALPVEREPKSDEPVTVASITSPTPRQAENKANNTPPAERVLVVTIDEPAVLVAARQEKNTRDEKLAVALEEKSVKEAKPAGLWQKMKQLKQGELLAKRDNPTDEDQGLLNRAYTGLKHSIEKGKTTKQ